MAFRFALGLLALSLGIDMKAQSDFVGLEATYRQQREAKNMDSSLAAARLMNTLAFEEQGDTSYWYALSARFIGVSHHYLNQLDSAAFYYQGSAASFKKHHPDHLDHAICLNNLGVLYRDLGDYKKAEGYYLECLAIKKKVLGEEHPSTIASIKNYANHLFRKGNYEESALLLLNVYEAKTEEVVRNFAWLEESLKESFWKNEGNFFSNMGFYCTYASSSSLGEFAEMAYDAALFSKGRLLESKLNEQDFEEGRSQIRNALKRESQQLTKMRSEGVDEIKVHDALEQRVDSLDRALKITWPEYAELHRKLRIDWEQVQGGLAPKEMAIEFVRYYDIRDSLHRYAALLLDSEMEVPAFVSLCTENDLAAWEVGHPGDLVPSRSLNYLIWNPLSDYLSDVEVIYYAAVDKLNTVPFHSIVLSERGQPTQYVMDRFEIHKLTSTRYLALSLKSDAQIPPQKSIVLFGGIDYDHLPGDPAAVKKRKKGANLERSSQYAGNSLKFLPATLSEVKQGSKILKSHAYSTANYTGSDAKEEVVYNLEEKGIPGILHFATHGYAFPEVQFNDASVSEHSLRYVYRNSPYPMVRSGLILASGNWKWTGSDTLQVLNMEDGILTALEASMLPLSDCKLVVMSACETGLGQIDGEEGTLGILRGFKLAGVEEVIATLWSVNDEYTREFFKEFYQNLGKTDDTINSFYETQKYMRDKYPKHPKRWAAFVLVR